MAERHGRLRRWQQRARQPRADEPDDVGFAGSQVGPLALLGLLIGGILGWLLSSGALPTPGWLPITPGEPLRAALIFGTLGALAAGGIGLLADLGAKIMQAEEAQAPPPID